MDTVCQIPARVSNFISSLDSRPQQATLTAWLSMTSTICCSSSVGLCTLWLAFFDLIGPSYRKCHQKNFKTQSSGNSDLWLIILYHFDQFDSHTSQAPVFCRKSVPVTGHRAQCQTGPMCDNAKRPKIYLKMDVFAGFANFGWCGLLLHPIGYKYSPKLPILALSKLLSVKILALSWSPATCVEVLNWSNLLQSQGCVELIEMVQYLQQSQKISKL